MEPVLLLLGLGLYLRYAYLLLDDESWLHSLCDSLSPGFYSRRPRNYFVNPFAWRVYAYRGNQWGRDFTMAYSNGRSSRLFRRQPRRSAELEISCPLIQKFWLRMLPNPGAGTEGELRLDDVLYDTCFLIHSNQTEAAAEFLREPQVREIFQCLPVLPDRLEIHRGRMSLLINRPRPRLDTAEALALLQMMFRLVELYEGQKSLQIIVNLSQEVCPFCRERLDGEQEPVVQCSCCHTRLHRQCWRENGQCTTWGCNAAEPAEF